MNYSKEPELLPIKLKRETVICHTNTLFQNKLSEVLYEGSEQGVIGIGLEDGDFAKTLIDTLMSKYQTTVNYFLSMPSSDNWSLWFRAAPAAEKANFLDLDGTILSRRTRNSNIYWMLA